MSDMTQPAVLWAGGVGLIRGCSFSKAELRDRAATLGQVESNPYQEYRDELCPWIYPVSSRGRGYPGVSYWHFDGSRLAERSRYTLMYAERVTSGVTLFCDAGAAYEALPRALQDLARTLEATTKPGVRRPLVQPHPDTGRLTLQFNALSTIESLPEPEGAELVATLTAHLDRLAFRHEWQPNDLVLFDNAAVLHRATEGKSEKLLYRVTTKY